MATSEVGGFFGKPGLAILIITLVRAGSCHGNRGSPADASALQGRSWEWKENTGSLEEDLNNTPVQVVPQLVRGSGDDCGTVGASA